LDPALTTEDGASAEQPAPLEPIALARARTTMLSRVLDLVLDDGATIRGWAARDLARDRALRLWLRQQPQSGPARVYADGVCEVDVLVEPETLRAKLTEMLEPAPVDDPFTAEAVSNAATAWPRLWATGAADPSMLSARKPVGWEDVSAENIARGGRAAAADALLALQEQIALLEVSPGVHVNEFFDASPAAFDAFRASLATTADVEVRLEPDQVALAEARIKWADLIALLVRVCDEHYEGDRFRAADFREMVLNAAFDELRAEGLAIPPTSSIASVLGPIELDAPPWAAKAATAAGGYQPQRGDAFAAFIVMEFSRLEAIVALEAQLLGLRLADRVTVGDLLGQHPDLKNDVVLLLSGARAMETTWAEDGLVTTRVELPLERLWLILTRAMRTVELDLDAEGQPVLNGKSQP
jgi:hypothetical protein